MGVDEKALEKAAWELKEVLGKLLGAKPLLGEEKSGDWWAEPNGQSIDCIDLLRPAIEAYEAAKTSVSLEKCEARELIGRLVEALEFYGDETKYSEHYKDHIFRTTYINEDRGRNARKALAEATKWMKKNDGQ